MVIEHPALGSPAAQFGLLDHCLGRILVSQGVPFHAPGILPGPEGEPRTILRTFAARYHLFAGTPV